MSASPTHATLADIWAAISAGTAKGYARDIAAEHGVSEAELVASGIGVNVIRLHANWGQFIEKLPALGNVKILTRNEDAVHEKIGTFDNIRIMGEMGLVLNRTVDLRLFMSHWAYGFAVTTHKNNTTQHSLQFFDHDGTAIHKIFVIDETNTDAFHALVAAHTAKDQAAPLAILPAVAKRPDSKDDDIDVEMLRARWHRMTDVHQFHSMLKELNVGRLQSLRLVGEEYAERLCATATKKLFESATHADVSIMVFVGNAGCIQIHTDPVQNFVEMRGWYNFMDPGFTLHLRADRVAQAWRVRKPTAFGIITTIELYNDNNENFAIFCGERPEQDPENPDWTKLANALPRFSASGHVQAAE
jgi:putative hemin transport protein